MNRTWQLQEAKARFSAFLEASVRDGPQIVTRRGVETAVPLPIERWRKLEKMERTNLKESLLAQEARTETLAPPRRSLDRRPIPAVD